MIFRLAICLVLFLVLGNANSVDELIYRVNQRSSIGFSIISTDELKNRNDMFSNIIPFCDVINFENRYNDDFFKNNMLLISVIGLESKYDTIEVTDIQYSKVYSKTHINYYKSNRKLQNDDKAGCIIVYEVPQDVGSRALNTCFGFSADNAEINYINK